MALAPANRDQTACLPPELIHRILDGLSFEELQPVLTLCARWREIALNHPTYWSTIALKSSTDAAISLFFARLARSGTRPVIIIIYMEDSSSCAASSLFPTLRDHLHHVVSLDVTLPVLFIHENLRHLTSVAPTLSAFRLCALWSNWETALPVLPIDLFAYNAPTLRDITLENVIIQAETRIPAFSEVTDVCFCFRPWDVPVPNVFVHFPSMVRLRFYNPVLLLDPAYFEFASWNNIIECWFHSGRMQRGLLHPTAAVVNVPFVSITQPTADEMALLVRQLLPPYRLECTRARHDPVDKLALRFAERGWGRQRYVCDRWDDWNDDSLGFRSAIRDGISQNILYLEVSALCWGCVVSLLSPMETLQILVLCITGNDDISALGAAGMLICPALERVAIRSADCRLSLAAVAAATFVRTAILEASMRFKVLFLENVELVGSSDYLRERFMAISHGG